MVNGMSWRVIPLAEAEKTWDVWLEGFADAHIKQTFAWANLKRGAWNPVFTGYFDGPTPMSLGLLMERAAPGGLMRVAWANGGPCFRKSVREGQNLAALRGWLDGAKKHLDAAGRGLLRINLAVAMDVKAQLVLREASFVRPLVPLSTGLSYILDLTLPEEEARTRLDRNWRNQLRQAEALSPTFDWGRGSDMIRRYLPLHEALCARKELAALRTTTAELERSAQALGERLQFALVGVDGRDGTGGAVWRLGDKAWGALFAADDFGNKRHLPNFYLMKVIARLKAEGAKTFDFMGIDPCANWGVYNFKRGLGAAPVEFIGEWEYAASDWTRRIFSAALWWRRDRMP